MARLPTLPSVNTYKEKTNLVGVGERAMTKTVQIDKHASQTVKDALDKQQRKNRVKKRRKQNAEVRLSKYSAKLRIAREQGR